MKLFLLSLFELLTIASHPIVSEGIVSADSKSNDNSLSLLGVIDNVFAPHVIPSIKHCAETGNTGSSWHWIAINLSVPRVIETVLMIDREDVSPS